MIDGGYDVSIEPVAHVAAKREQGTVLDERWDPVTPPRPVRFPVACDSGTGADRTPTLTGAFDEPVCVPS